jgi:hypothetical protein
MISGTSRRGSGSDLTTRIWRPNTVAPRDFLWRIFNLWKSAKWVRGITLIRTINLAFGKASVALHDETATARTIALLCFRKLTTNTSHHKAVPVAALQTAPLPKSPYPPSGFSPRRGGVLRRKTAIQLYRCPAAGNRFLELSIIVGYYGNIVNLRRLRNRSRSNAISITKTGDFNASSLGFWWLAVIRGLLISG